MKENIYKRYLDSSKITIQQIASLENVREVSISPDGSRVAYFLEKFELTNVWNIPIKGGVPTQVTFGSTTNGLSEPEGPAWSPDGQMIAFVSDRNGNNDIWIAPSGGGAEHKVTSNKANNRQPRWSPDGNRIAFTSDMSETDDIYTISIEDGSIASVTRDSYDNEDPKWSPDGGRIAYSSRRGNYYYNHDVLVVPSGGGDPTNITDSPDSNDFSPQWSPDGSRIAFVSDRMGCENIWLVSPDGADLKQLTTGESDKQSPRWSPDGGMIAYIDNVEGDLQLCAVPSSDGRPRVLIGVKGVHNHPAWSPDGRHILVSHSSPSSCPELFLISVEDGKMTPLTQIMPPSLRKASYVAPEKIRYRSFDGLEILGFLFAPPGREMGKRYPALVYPHGGPTAQYTDGWDPFAQYLVQRGYVILSPNFRGGTGQGKRFRDANDGDWGGGDLQDIVHAAKYLRTLEYVIPDRIGVWGGSYGGYMTLLALTKEPGAFKVGIDLYGVTNRVSDWDQTDRVGRINFLDFGDIKHCYELFRDRSPINFVNEMSAPLLILHGEEDPRVPFAQSTELVEVLKEKRKFHEFVAYPGEKHGFRRYRTILDAYDRIEKFLAKWL